MTIVFSGRRWRVVEVHDRDKVIAVAPDAAGRPPTFGGEGGDLHDRVAETMRAVYGDEGIPPYLDAAARELLIEGRAVFRRYDLDRVSLVPLDDRQTLLFPWRGTVATATLAVALTRQGLTATPRHLAIEIAEGPDEIEHALTALSQSPAPEPVELAACMRNLVREKFHPYLNRSLLEIDAASERIDAAAIPGLAAGLVKK